MIPNKGNFLDKAISRNATPTKDWKLDHKRKRVGGFIDGIEALKQSIFINLSIQNKAWIIHTDDFGFQGVELYGTDKVLSAASLERKIKEAIGWDDRIISLTNFQILEIGDTYVHASFDVVSTEGNFKMEVPLSVRE